MRPNVDLVVAPHRSPATVENDSSAVELRGSRATAARDALARLRTAVTNVELADRIPVELCGAGFGRVLFSLIQDNTWVVRSAHVTGDTALGDALLAAGRAHPRRLCQPLPESAMIRTKRPILVADPLSDPRVYSDLVAVVKSDVYVAAPVYAWQRPVGLLHADAPSSDGDVGPEDRDLLGVFAEGLGAIMERNFVVERMGALQLAASAHVEALDTFTSVFGADLPGHSETRTPPRPDRMSADVAQKLTRREIQVLNLLAAGKTNTTIAGRLFISEGTVKSHIGHILNKLDARNRTEAVARYRELTAGSP